MLNNWIENSLFYNIKKTPVLEPVVFSATRGEGGERLDGGLLDLRASQISAPWIRENKILLTEERSLAFPPPPLRIWTDNQSVQTFSSNQLVPTLD